MLYYETVSPDCQKLLRELMSMEELKRFRLVGGTALSLQFGHRISVDLDLFTDKTFDEEGLERKLLQAYPSFAKERSTSTGFSAYIGNIKVDFYNWSLPFIRPQIEEDSLRLCQAVEIGAMKLDAITRRQEKKDFFDLFELLKRYSLSESMNVYKEKYPFNNDKIPLEVLKMCHLADASPDPKMLAKVSWNEVKSFLEEAVSEYFSNQKAIKDKKLEDRIAKVQLLLDKKTPPDA